MAMKGLAQLSRKMTALPRAAKDAARKAVVVGAIEIQNIQQNLVPYKDGELHDSIVVTPPNSRTPPYSQPGGEMTTGDTQAVVTAGNTAVRYAHLVEFGTAPHVIKSKDGVTPMGKNGIFGLRVNHPGAMAQPFFWPGYRAVRNRVRSRVTREINKAIKTAATSGGSGA